MEDHSEKLSFLVMGVLVLSALFALCLSFVLIYAYKKALIKGMGYSSSAYSHDAVQTNQAPHDTEVKPVFIVYPVLGLLSDSSDIYNKIKETLGYHWFVYIAMCFTFSLVMSCCFAETATVDFNQFVIYIITFSFPIVPISFILLTSGLQQKIGVLIILGFLYLAGFYIFSNETLPFGPILIQVIIVNIIPIVIIFLLRLPAIRSLGLFAFSFVIICVFGPTLLMFFLSTKTDTFNQLGLGFINNSLPPLPLFLIRFAFIILASLFIAWIIHNRIKRLYIRKWVNDMQLNADSCVILFNLTYSLILLLECSTMMVVSLLAFPVYKITGYILYYFLRKRRVRSISPRLLLLRVFALGKSSRSLFDRLVMHWRYLGSIEMISGPDLATETVDPHEIISFVSGQLDTTFCEDQASIDRNISRTDTAPDMDGTHRVNEFFCRENNWKEVLQKLVSQSDIVLMDLRSFSAQYKGCQYEIEALIHSVSLDKIVFLIDERTDVPFTEKIFTHAFHSCPAASVNKSKQPKVVLYKINTGNEKEIAKLLNLLCAKV